MSVWKNDQATCNHEGSERFFDYKEGSKVEWCGDCGKELSRTPDPNQGTHTRREDLDTYFRIYADEAKAAEPRIAILSLSGWVQSGRPTFAQYHRRPSQPTQTPIEGDTEMTTATETVGTSTTATKEKKARPAGAKALVRQIFTADPNAEFSIAELASQTGKPASSITTAISDLRSAKYCKPGDPLKLNRHKNGKYSLKEPVAEEVAPATPENQAAAPATTAVASTEEVLPA